MTSSIRRSRDIVACCLVTALGAGCADAPPGDPGSSEPRDHATASVETLSFAEAGDLLLAFETPEGDWVSFYGFEDGSIAAVGRLGESAAPALRASLEEATRGGNLGALYRALTAGEPDPKTLARLDESDARSSQPGLEDAELSARPDPSDLGSEHRTAAAFDPAASSDIENRASANCFQSDTFYQREADGWARHNCVTTNGVPNVLCRTNRDDRILYDWHRLRRFRATAFNQTRCNEAVFTCTARWTTNWGFTRHTNRFFATEVGPRQQFFCLLNTERDNLDATASISDVSGPERAHLCLAANRVR